MGILDYCNSLVKENKEVVEKLELYTDVSKNVVVDPHTLIDYRLKKEIINNKLDFLTNIFASKLNTCEDIKQLVNSLEDGEQKNSYLKEMALKEESTLSTIYSRYVTEVEEMLEKDPTAPNPFVGLIPSQKFEKFKQIFEKNEDLQKEYNKELFARFRGIIVSSVKRNPEGLTPLFKSMVNEDIEKEFKEELKNNPPLEEIDETRVFTYKEDIDEFKKIATSIEEKETLDYVQNEIMTKLNDDAIGYYSEASEEYGKKTEQNLREIVIESQEKDERFKGIIKRTPNSQTTCTLSFDGTNIDPINVKKESMTLKAKFTDNTKDILKKILVKLEKMERYNIPPKNNEPLFSLEKFQPEEGDPKVYGFIGLKDLYNKTKTLLKNKTPENLKELKKLTEFHKNMIKDYDELIDLAKQLNSSSICGNINSSRVKELPTKYIKDYENVSKINEMWQTLAVIKRANCTIDEYLNDPTGIYRKTISDLKDFKFIDDIGKNKDPLEFMRLLTKSSTEVRNVQDALLAKTNIARSVGSIGHFEKDNMAHNALVAELNHGLIEEEAFPAIFSSTSNYFEKDSEVQTLKNLIVCQDETISKVKLTANPNFNHDVFTGEKINDFNYEKYLDEREIDINKLANTLLALKEKVETDKKYKGFSEVFKKAARSITKDMQKTKDIKHLPEYAAFMEASGYSCESIVKAKKDMKPHSYSRSVLEDFKNEPDKNKNISRLLVTYKGLNDSYNKRSILSKIFSPNAWKERNARSEIKEELLKQNFEEKELDDLLKNASKPSTLTNKFVESLKPGKIEAEHVEISNKDLNIIENSEKSKVTTTIKEKDLDEIIFKKDSEKVK